MRILVQKYGGTSVGSTERIKNVAKKIIEDKLKGNKMVVIVSAMAGQTDNLIKLANEITSNPLEQNKREMDMLLATGEQVSIALLAMALNAMGHKAISFTANQIGIFTDKSHTKAKIEKIETKRIMSALEDDYIVIIAGFQGVDEEYNFTTLGRGGSDTSAVAIAAALKADICEIYTDVDGVYTADPRIVKNAKKLEAITYDEMLELASVGAKVLHSRSVEFAKKYDVIIEVKSSFTNVKGTLVLKESKEMEQVVVSSITAKKDEAKLTIVGVPDKPGMAAKIFHALSEAAIVVNVIVQSAVEKESKTNDISFTVPATDFQEAANITQKVAQEIGAKEVLVDQDIALISIVGIGMKSHSGVARDMFKVLADNNINIQMISTSEIKITCVIDKKDADKAVQCLHEHFIK